MVFMTLAKHNLIQNSEKNISNTFYNIQHFLLKMILKNMIPIKDILEVRDYPLLFYTTFTIGRKRP